MEKAGLKACIDALRGNRSLAESMSMIVSAEYDEQFSTSNEWYSEVIAYLKTSGSHEGISQLLLTLCRFCQFTFMSERVDIESDLKKRIAELGERVGEGQTLIKQQPQYAPVVYAAEAAFYLYTASLNIRSAKKNRQANRPSLDGSFALLALSYDLSVRASAHFVELSASPTTIESKILAQAERLNNLNCVVTAAMLVEKLRSSQQARVGGTTENWSSKVPNLLADSQTCIRRTLDVKENATVMTSLCYSSPNALLSSSIPSTSDLLTLFERALISSLDLQTLVWCIVHLRRYYPISSSSSSHQFTDALILESLVKGEALRRCSHLPSSLAGDFSSPSADALCQLDVLSFILMAAARIELSIPPLDESVADTIQPPFFTNSAGSTELGGENLWLTTSQIQWWRAVTLTHDKQQTNQPPQDPFTKFRLIQDGLFLLRLSGIDAKLLPMAIRVAESFQALVLEHFFNFVHHESASDFQKSITLSPDVRRFHTYCSKYWDGLLQFIHASRSTPHHHGQRISLGGAGGPPSRQQRFFEPFPLLAHSGSNVQLDALSGGMISSELKSRISNCANFYLGFDAFLSGNNDASVKLFKSCSTESAMACFFEGRAFEAMADEAQEKSVRSSSSSSSWVVRQLYESALTSYEKAINYSQNNTHQVQRAVVIEVASKGAARVKKHLLGASKATSAKGNHDEQRAVSVPVNGGCDNSAYAESPVPQAVTAQQQQVLALIQQQQEQSLSALNSTVGQLVPAIRDLSSAARDLADVARQLRDLERQLRESVVRMECGIQQQQQRPPSSAATATPPVSNTTPAGGITAEQLLPLLMDLIRERNVPQPTPLPHTYISPSPQNLQSQPSLLMRQLGLPPIGPIGGDQGPIGGPMMLGQPSTTTSFGLSSVMKAESFEVAAPTQFPPTCALSGVPFQQQSMPPPPPIVSSAFSPLVPAPQQSAQHAPVPQRLPTVAVNTINSHSAPAQPPATVAPLFNSKPNAPEPVQAKSQPQQQQQQQPKPLADLFRPAVGTWSCSTCLVRNNETSERCVACETPRPAGAPTAGTPATSKPVAKPLPQITFGSPAAAATDSKQATPQPIFGHSLFPKPTGDTGGIQFGMTGSPLFGVPKPAVTSTASPASTVTATTPKEAPQPQKPFAVPTTTTASVPVPKKQESTPVAAGTNDAAGGDEESSESPEEFVPTAEYNPVAQLPQNYEVVTGEENEERLFSDKAKLYRWADATNEWKERGVGEMKVLKNIHSGRARILMRREQVLKPCANHYITADFILRPFAAVGDRGFCWLAADFAEVESGDQPQIMQLAIRFRNVEAAQEFRRVIESCRGTATISTKSPERPSNTRQQQQPAKPTQPTQPAKPAVVETKPAAPAAQPAAPKPAPVPAAVPPATTVGGSQPSGLPVPVFGSSFVKRTEAPAATVSAPASGLFSFAALAAANAPKSEVLTSTTTSATTPFIGQPEPLFKSLLAKTATPPAGGASAKPAAASAAQDQAGDDGAADEGGEGVEPENFVPTSEYKPVVELPSDYKHVSGEEGFERVFSERCKLYRWDSNTNEWKERGLGDIRLMKATDGSSKHRIVMRREHIHTVCANHYLTITPSMKLGRLPSAADRAVTWFAASDYSDGEAKMETFCARFKAPAVADKFSSTFEAALNELGEKYGGDKSPAKSASQDSKQPVAPTVTKPSAATTSASANSATITTTTTTTTSTDSSIKPQSTPAFSFRADSSPTVGANSTGAFSQPSTLFGGFKASPAVAESSTSASSSTTPFSGFRFGALTAPGAATPATPATTTTPPTSQPKNNTAAFGNLFGGASSGNNGGASANNNMGFSFSGVFPSAATTTTTPAEAKNNGSANGTKTNTAMKGRDTVAVGEDDCVLVGTTHANPDEVARARQYQLPDDFYLYRLRKPCNGCAGCENCEQQGKLGGGSNTSGNSSAQATLKGGNTPSTANSNNAQSPSSAFFSR